MAPISIHSTVSPQQSPWRLDGRTALVTGAAQGLGAAIAQALARAGAAVALIDASTGAQQVAEDLRAEGCEALDLQADVCDESAFGAAFGMILPLVLWTLLGLSAGLRAFRWDARS